MNVSATERVTSIERLKELIGQELRVSAWRQVTQEQVDVFAELTGDNGWIHVDQERAAKSSFGGTLAQGNLTLSIAASLLEEGTGADIDLPMKFGLHYGFNRVRFMRPVVVGKRVRARLKLLEVRDVSPNVYQITWQRTVEVEVEVEGAAKPAMVAEAISWAYF